MAERRVEHLRDEQNRLLVTSIDLPIVAQVPQAIFEHPYLGLAYRLEQKDIAQVLADGHLVAPSGTRSHRAMTVGTLNPALVSAFVRLLDPLGEPESIPFLALAIGREILYRLLTIEVGDHLRQVGLMGSQNAQILRAVEWMKSHFAEPLLVESLADYCRMSRSAFHLHFRRVTAMSPIPYQKWLRLKEARRLMVTSDLQDITLGVRKSFVSPLLSFSCIILTTGGTPCRTTLRPSRRLPRMASRPRLL